MRFQTNCALADWLDRRVIDQHGEPVGVVVDIYVDADTGRAVWVAISTGFFGTRRVVAPVRGASLLGGDVILAQPRELVLSAPTVHALVVVPPHEQQLLVNHYTARCEPRDTAERHEP